MSFYLLVFFFFQAEDGIRDGTVTGVQTCALPICFGIATLSAYLYVRGRGLPRPIPRTATYRPAAGAREYPKPAGRSTGRNGPFQRGRLRADPARLPPRTPGHLNTPTGSSSPIHLPSTPDAPSMYFLRTSYLPATSETGQTAGHSIYVAFKRYRYCEYLTAPGPETPAQPDAGLGLPWSSRILARHTPQLFRCDGLLSEGVEHLYSGQLKVLDVAGDHGHAVYPRRCCNERVDHREGLRVLLTAPGSGDREGDRENPILEPGLHIPEPALEGGSLVPVSPAADSRDPLLDLAQGQHGDVQPARRRGRDPVGYARRRLALARLRQHVGVEQVGHVPASRSTARPKSALRSASISAKTSAMPSSSLGPPSRMLARSTAGRVSLRYSPISTTTATSSPCRVMTCGPSVVTARIISLKRCLASWICQ